MPAEPRNQVDNPFNPGSGTPPPFLAGRDREIAMFEEILKSITNGKLTNVILTGLRGTGKTVLLNKFREICEREKFFPIMRSQFSSKHNDLEEFSNALSFGMNKAVDYLSTKKKISRKLQSIGSLLKPSAVGVPGVVYYEFTYEKSRMPFEDYIETYLSHNWPVFEKSKYKGVVFLFDEFHLISDVATKKHYVMTDFIGAINELQKNKIPYHLVLTGLPKLLLNVKKARSYSERMFTTIELNNLLQDEAALAISTPLNNSPRSFSRELIDAIVDDTGQYPYFIQFYCRAIIEQIDKKRISLRDYESIKPVIIERLDRDFYGSRVESLTKKEKEVLISMTSIDKEDLEFKDIRATSTIAKNSLSQYLSRLEAKGLIHRHRHGTYRYSLPMLRDYVVRKY